METTKYRLVWNQHETRVFIYINIRVSDVEQVKRLWVAHDIILPPPLYLVVMISYSFKMIISYSI